MLGHPERKGGSRRRLPPLDAGNGIDPELVRRRCQPPVLGENVRPDCWPQALWG